MNKVIYNQSHQQLIAETICDKDREVISMSKTLCIAYNLSEYESKYYSMIFYDFSKQYRIPWEIYPAFVKVESNYNPRARSESDAKGLTQLLESTGKATAKNLDINYKANETLWNDIHNLVIGLTYFSQGIKDDTTKVDSLVNNHCIARYIGGPGYARNMKKNKNTKSMIESYLIKVNDEFIKLKYIHKGVKSDGTK